MAEFLRKKLRPLENKLKVTQSKLQGGHKREDWREHTHHYTTLLIHTHTHTHTTTLLVHVHKHTTTLYTPLDVKWLEHILN